MKKPFDQNELQERIELNFKRLEGDPYYQIGAVFAPKTYEWYGDKEGRALLAFVDHYKMHGRKIACMDEMMAQMEKMTNEFLYFGPLANKIIHEQQLSGHSWLLRGLCEYYEQFGDEVSLKMIRSICEHLYLPTRYKYSTYPTNREEKSEGDVSGSTAGVIGTWKLSTDIGCAFMSIDGLSHAYCVLGDNRIKELVDEMIEVYLAIDKKKLKAQTHCTLTAARGMMRMYELTRDSKYLDGAKQIYKLYTEDGGMTLVYQNVNWWGRNDTWTEPCAIVDSLILSAKLYLATKEEEYRRTAARIYHNGLATSQRANGGAGTDSIVLRDGGSDTLFSQMYEAYFCCTMRLAEGLWFISDNRELFEAEYSGELVRTPDGIYMDGDIIYAEITNAEGYLSGDATLKDSHILYPLLKYYKVEKEAMDKIRQKIIFD